MFFLKIWDLYFEVGRDEVQKTCGIPCRRNSVDTTPHGPELHLDVFNKLSILLYRAKLHLNVSTPHGPELHMDVAAQQEPLLLMDLAAQQGGAPGRACTSEACAAPGPRKTEAFTWTCPDNKILCWAGHAYTTIEA
jgi:hypothetical protein